MISSDTTERKNTWEPTRIYDVYDDMMICKYTANGGLKTQKKLLIFQN